MVKYPPIATPTVLPKIPRPHYPPSLHNAATLLSLHNALTSETELMLAPVPLPVVFEREINCVVETMPGDEWERRNLREGHELHEVLEAAVLLMAHHARK